MTSLGVSSLGSAILGIVGLAVACLGLTSPTAATPLPTTPTTAAEAPSPPSPWEALGRHQPDTIKEALEEVAAPQEASTAGLSNYFRHLLRETLGNLFSAIGDGLSYLPISAKATLALARGIAALVLIFLLWQLSRILLRRLGGPSADRPKPPQDLKMLPPEGQGGQEDWRRRWQEALASGRLEEALEALWWWLARRLAGDEVDPSWSTGQLLRTARRRDLAPLARRLDGYQYGPSRPSPEEIRDLATLLEGSLS